MLSGQSDLPCYHDSSILGIEALGSEKALTMRYYPLQHTGRHPVEHYTAKTLIKGI